MGRKSSVKAQTPPQSPPPPKRLVTPLVVVLLGAVLALVGLVSYWQRTSPPSQDVAQSATPAIADVPEIAKRPHPQANLPPLQFPAHPMSRPPEVLRATYKFAAEHPEVLSYVPCFCGCERSGHRGNEDCFVRARDVNADVIEWNDHGMDCAVCVDVANRAMQMHASGASVRDIRATIDKEWASKSTNRTPTPLPPQN